MFANLPTSTPSASKSAFRIGTRESFFIKPCFKTICVQMSLPGLENLSLKRLCDGFETSTLTPRDKADELKANDTFYTDNNNENHAFYMFKKHAMKEYTLKPFQLISIWGNISSFLMSDMPPDIVDYDVEYGGEIQWQYSFKTTYRYRVDLRLPDDDDPIKNEPFKSVKDLSIAELRRSRLIPSMENMKVDLLRSVWSQHYPATDTTDHFVQPQPILSSDTTEVGDASVQMEDFYVIEDVMQSFFTRETWEDHESILDNPNTDYMNKTPNFKHLALHKLFEVMLITDSWERHDMSTQEKKVAFEAALSYDKEDRSEQLLQFFSIEKICSVVVIYRLLILVSDALTNMYVKPPDGPLYIMQKQSLYKQEGVMDSLLRREIDRLKEEIKRLGRNNNERESRRKALRCS